MQTSMHFGAAKDFFEFAEKLRNKMTEAEKQFPSPESGITFPQVRGLKRWFEHFSFISSKIRSTILKKQNEKADQKTYHQQGDDLKSERIGDEPASGWWPSQRKPWR